MNMKHGALNGESEQLRLYKHLLGYKIQAKCPRCGTWVGGKDGQYWQVVEEVAGVAFSIEPSVEICPHPFPDRHGQCPGWHGFFVDGEFQRAPRGPYGKPRKLPKEKK